MATGLNEWISKEKLSRLSWRVSTRAFEPLTQSRISKLLLAAVIFPGMYLQLSACRSGGYLYQCNKAILIALPVRPGPGIRYMMKLTLLGGFAGFAFVTSMNVVSVLAEDSGAYLLSDIFGYM